MANDFTFKTNLVKMHYKRFRLRTCFIHIPAQLQKDLDKKFKGKQPLQVQIEKGMQFIGKIMRINNKSRNTKTYYIRIPASYNPLIEEWMFTSITVILTPI